VARFIERRRRRWYAVWDVPKDCRAVFGGKARMVKSLGTENQKEAILLASALVTGWKLRCEQARGEGDLIAAHAAMFREALAQATDEDERDAIRDQLADL